MSVGLSGLNIVPQKLPAQSSSGLRGGESKGSALQKGSLSEKGSFADVQSSKLAEGQNPSQTLLGSQVPSPLIVSGSQSTSPIALGGEIESTVDELVEGFIREMEKKTGASPVALLTGITDGLQHLPNTEKFIEVFTQHVRTGVSAEGKSSFEVSPTEIEENLKSFLREIQATLQGAEPGRRSVGGEGKNFEFEVLTAGEARDRRSQEIVERSQGEFFGNQARPRGAEDVGRSPGNFSRFPQSSENGSPQKPGFQSTSEFFKNRQTEVELKDRLQRVRPSESLMKTSVQSEASDAMVETATALNASSSSSDTTSEVQPEILEFNEALLEKVLPTVQGGSNTSRSQSVSSVNIENALATSSAGQIPESKVENIHEIIQGARATARNGGGEMEIELRPEGLGKVQVKVSVVGDQVQVQMIAQNKQVQDLLKDGLQDLRGQLASQKLNLETVKVESAQETLAQFNEQKDQESSSRQMGQGMMQQFREERNSARRSMQTFPDATSRSEQRSTSVIQPMGVNSRSHEGRLSLIA